MKAFQIFAAWRGLWMAILALPVLFIFGGALYACASHRMLKKEIAATPRDPATGIVAGLEARDLDPPRDYAGRAGGDGPTTACLLLHGFVGSHRDFANLGPALAERGYHVRLARLPGHATRPDDFARQTPETMMQYVSEEYHALKARYPKVIVVGFSMGGTLATLLAEAEPVDGLVLIAPFFAVTYKPYYVLPPELWNAMMYRMLPYVIKSDFFIKVNRPEAKRALYSYHAVPTRGAKTLIELGRRARRPEALKKIQCPVFMMIAEGDDASSPGAARKVFGQIASPCKEAHWFGKRSNHHLLWDYDRDEAQAAVVGFIAAGG